jgi:hypothetical protein
MPLPRAPRHPVGPDGRAVFGAFEGSCESTSLVPPTAPPSPVAAVPGSGANVLASALHGVGDAGRKRLARVARLAREKRWVWFGLADGRLAVSGAIVDLGYLGALFFWVFDREQKRLALDGTATVPPFLVTIGDRPGEGLRARARTHRGHLGIDWRHGTVELRGSVLGADLSVALAVSTRPVTAVCPVRGEAEGVNVTQKATCLPVSGTVRWGGRVRSLDNALGSLDYTHGLLPRETSWRWVCAWGRGPGGKPVGVNLVEGFNDGLENVVWLEGRPCPVGPARVVHDAARPGAPWRVTTVDGLVDLSLQVEAVRREDVDVGLAAVRFAQVFGGWSGRVGDLEVRGLSGVAEDHSSRW